MKKLEVNFDSENKSYRIVYGKGQTGNMFGSDIHISEDKNQRW